MLSSVSGKFQMQVLSGCGHAVHEDAPDKVLYMHTHTLTH